MAAEPLIVREPTSGTRAFIEDLFSQSGLQIRYGPELNNDEVIKSMVAAGLGVAVLSTKVVGHDVRSGRLQAVTSQGSEL